MAGRRAPCAPRGLQQPTFLSSTQHPRECYEHAGNLLPPWQDREINSYLTRYPEDSPRETCFFRNHVHSSPISKMHQSPGVLVCRLRRGEEPYPFNFWYPSPPHLSAGPEALLRSLPALCTEPSIPTSKPILGRSL